MDHHPWAGTMSFRENLIRQRKANKLTQRELAEKIGLSVEQIKKYEAGKCQPTLEVIKRMSLTFGVSSDTIIFDEEERQPSSDKLLTQFKAISQFDDKDQEVVSLFLDAYIKKHRFEEMMTG